jgi:1-acyl-sn-glycerol-3-phosphate acyltransferase
VRAGVRRLEEIVIAAKRNAFLDALFYRYLLGKLRQRFQNVYLRGGAHLAALPPDRAVIAFANHTNWWDLLMLFRLTREIPKRCYGMMEEKHLRKYAFFRAIGGFSVDLDSKLGAALGLRYALRLLKKPESFVWIFPQGRLATPYEPIEARPGLSFLCRRAPKGTLLLPVAFRYEFFRDDLPVALIDIGAPLPADGEADVSNVAALCQDRADRLAEAAQARDLSGFVPLLPPRLSINKKWEWVCRAATGRLAGFDPSN